MRQVPASYLPVVYQYLSSPFNACGRNGYKRALGDILAWRRWASIVLGDAACEIFLDLAFQPHPAAWSCVTSSQVIAFTEALVETESCCHQHVSVCNRLKLLSVSVPHLLVGKSEHGRKVGAR
jgi:hypothetical protein